MKNKPSGALILSILIHAVILPGVIYAIAHLNHGKTSEVKEVKIQVSLITNEQIPVPVPEVKPQPAKQKPRAVKKQPLKIAQPLENTEKQVNGEPAAEQVSQPVATGQTSASEAAIGKADYYAKLRSWLEKHKTYPRAARSRGIEGEAKVSFTIDRSGAVLSSSIVTSSGNDLLDEAALEAVTNASPLPPIPEELSQDKLSLTVPFGFGLKR